MSTKYSRAGYRDVLHTTGDSVKDRIRHDRGGNPRKDLPLLDRARAAWESLSNMRNRRLRNLRYVFGDQWSDLVYDRYGNLITERQAMQKKKQVPLQNNHLIKLVNALTGTYAKSSTLPVVFARKKDASEKAEMMTDALQTNWENNLERELMSSIYQELIVGGLAVAREEWGTVKNEEDSYTFPVNSSYFFWESQMGDPRNWDVSLVGEIRDYTLNDLAVELATTKEEYDHLKRDYQAYFRNTSGFATVQQTERYKQRNLSWDLPSGDNLCRTYDIWTKECKLRYRCIDMLDKENPMYRIDEEDLPNIKLINQERIDLAIRAGLITPDMTRDEITEAAGLIEYQQIYDHYWHYQKLTPWGEVLQEMDSPYEHNSHPYTFRAYYLANGDIIPFITTALDPQRYINRLYMMNDMIMNAGAKGLKFIPSNLIPKDMSREEFMEQCVEIGGTIFYKPDPKNPTAMPQFFTNNANSTGITDLISLQIQSLNEMTSVSEALQGKTPANGTPAARYAMEYENSTTAIAALIQKFSVFENEVANKKLKVIHQYYQSSRPISHKNGSGYSEYRDYEPKEVRDIDFYSVVKDTPESPVARMALNEFVMQLWQTGAINVMQLLDNCYLPGIDGLKASVQQQLEQVQQGQPPQQIPNAVAQPIYQQANPQLQSIFNRQGGTPLQQTNIA